MKLSIKNSKVTITGKTSEIVAMNEGLTKLAKRLNNNKNEFNTSFNGDSCSVSLAYDNVVFGTAYVRNAWSEVKNS